MVLNKNIEAFVVYISSLSLGLRMTIHPAKKVSIVLLLAKEVTVLAEYSDFANIFLKKSANIFPKQTKANKHTIKLE